MKVLLRLKSKTACTCSAGILRACIIIASLTTCRGNPCGSATSSYGICCILPNGDMELRDWSNNAYPDCAANCEYQIRRLDQRAMATDPETQTKTSTENCDDLTGNFWRSCDCSSLKTRDECCSAAPAKLSDSTTCTICGWVYDNHPEDGACKSIIDTWNLLGTFNNCEDSVGSDEVGNADMDEGGKDTTSESDIDYQDDEKSLTPNINDKAKANSDDRDGGTTQSSNNNEESAGNNSIKTSVCGATAAWTAFLLLQ